MNGEGSLYWPTLTAQREHFRSLLDPKATVRSTCLSLAASSSTRPAVKCQKRAIGVEGVVSGQHEKSVLSSNSDLVSQGANAFCPAGVEA